MKTSLLFLIILISFFINIAFAKSIALQDSTISVGAGYSADTQQVTPQYCYNAKAGPLGGSENQISLDTAVSFTDLEKQLKFSVSASGGYGMFSGSAEASYLREVEDKDYSFSLNYYEYADATVPVQLQGYGEQALTSVGQQFYQDGNNPYFGIICGDNYISSYKEGALLTMALNIKFKSHYEKEEFQAKAGASYANIFSASAHIQQIATEYHMQGTISLEAYQRGGDPSQLSKILSKGPDGKYYILSCDIQHMDDCVKAASGLLDYAKSDFTTQFSFKNNTGLTALGLGFADYEPIYYIGLQQPKSFVTPQVKQDRISLATEFTNNKYYYSKLGDLLLGYPVAWDTTSDFYNQLTKLRQQASNNIDILKPADNPNSGALGCYNHPDKCDELYQTLQSQMQPITANDLKFLTALEYYYRDAYADYFYIGNDDIWGFSSLPNEDHIYKVIYSHFNDPNNINYQINTTGTTQYWTYTYKEGVVQPDGKTVKIQKERNDGSGFHDSVIYRCKSPFFFTVKTEKQNVLSPYDDNCNLSFIK